MNNTIHSIKQIAEAPLPTVEAAIKDAKAAKSLQSACKTHLKKPESSPASSSQKRSAAGAAADGSGMAKRARHSESDFMGGPVEMTPQELESSLELPLCLDEERIWRTSLQTNRAPLVLAFAVELLRYTMPEQPLSSRLSLAQAVVSANSRSKAVSLGLEKGPSADDEGWGEGQPRVQVMGRTIAVLKRSGYEWKGEEEVGDPETPIGAPASHDAGRPKAVASTPTFEPTSASAWAASQSISLKSSTFIARVTHITDASQRQVLIRALFEANPDLETASHNAWAYRIRPPSGSTFTRAREESFDDGETGCGDLMLRIMREADAVDTLVVLTRWFGGILLGPDRWRLMRNCVTSALSERLRKTGAEVSLAGEAVWGLDLEGMRSKSTVGGYGSGAAPHETSVVGVTIHRPEAARSYILKSFASAPADSPGQAGPDNAIEHGAESPEEGGSGEAQSRNPKRKKSQPGKPPRRTQQAVNAEKEENLGLLLGALRLLLDSWADHVTAAELDRRAWSWYCAVRPEVETGPSGWGAKGLLRLGDILDLQRKA